MKMTEKVDFLRENWEGLSREEKATLVVAIVDSGEINRHELSKQLNVHHSAVNRLYDFGSQHKEAEPAPAAEPEPEVSDGGVKEQITQKGDLMDVVTKSSRIKNIDDLIAHCQIDLKDWDLIESTVNKWEMGAAEKSKSIWLEGKHGNRYLGYEQGDTKIIVEPLFQVKARFRKKVSIINARAELDAMKEEWKLEAPVYAPFILPERQHENMLEINITDHHVGNMCWGPETGQNYDLKIAQRLFDEAVEASIERSKGYGLAKIVFVVGNDLLHFDNLENSTTAGTVVTADTRFHKVYRTTRLMVTRSIRRLNQIAPVEVILCPGNHDTVSSFTLGDALEVEFAHTPSVLVHNAPRPRKYTQFGKCMIMWTHGNKGKLEDYPLIMATEQPKMWGDTVYREAHTGDKHQRKLIELHGVAVRILPTLCATDDWATGMTFCQNVRCTEGFLWNKEEGMIGTIMYNLPAEYQLPQGEAA